ncbi:MAG: ABC transporter ATP-binding protein [Candidatus Pacebacteria bacterium]|nr:ABC transporter ATP-binding protein [Candidatus Paceibacterota bacterium]MBP9772352.1 ABC transporter ATP-binding protein [Candidatus Paceibacterota bacterium]QQR76805.1 MAG: ABC transporter ATP-binding protein [Candidatus Nomurabacteria bacterium]
MQQKQLFAPVWKHWKKAFYAFRKIAFATMLFYGIAIFIESVLEPVFWKMLIDSIVAKKGDTLVFFSLIAVGGVFAWMANRLGDWFIVHTETKIIKYLKDYAIKDLLKRSTDFFLSTFAGSIVAKSRRFAGTTETVFDEFVFTLLRVFIILCGVFFVVFSTMPGLGFVFVVWTLSFLLLSFYFSKKRTPYDLRSADADSHTTGHMSDIIGSVHMIHSYTAEDREHDEFKKTTYDEYKHRAKAWLLGNKFNAIQSLLVLTFKLVSMYIVIRQATLGLVTIGTVVLIYSYIGTLTSYMWQVSRAITNIRKSLADAYDMSIVLSEDPTIQDTPEPKKLNGDRTICFNDVSFKYPNKDSVVLDHLNLCLKPGKRYGFVGTTGAGKTTITRLLLRQFDIPDGYGSITIGKVDIRDITQKELRQTLSYVSQDPSFPHRKIKEIIAFGKPDATMEEIVAAAKRASCHSFITEKLEKGYDTLVGERGVKLSGGQRQRLAIAAAFLKDAEILMLDEPTSALDTETENEVQMVLREMVGKTMLVIAHRLTTVAQLDEIIVIDGGRVYERGTHNELMNLPDGLYRSLWERQYANLEQN